MIHGRLQRIQIKQDKRAKVQTFKISFVLACIPDILRNIRESVDTSVLSSGALCSG